MQNHVLRDRLAEYDTHIVMGTGRGLKPACRLLDTTELQQGERSWTMGTMLAMVVVAQGLRHRISGEQGGEGNYWADCTCLNCPTGRSLPRGCH
jgi:hypothetical protein